MAKQLQCNSCGAKYPDTRDGKTSTYFHACPDRIIDQPEQVDADHNIVKPATFKAVENPRNENLIPSRDTHGTLVMVSEGAGVTELE